MDVAAFGLGGLGNDCGQSGRKGLAHPHVYHQTRSVEEGHGALAGSVDQLVGHHDVQRLDVLAHAADGAHGDDPLHAERLERPDVGAGVDGGGRNAVAATMAREEGHLHAVQAPATDGVAGIAERRRDRLVAYVFQARHVVEPAAANNADGWHQTAFRISGGLA